MKALLIQSGYKWLLAVLLLAGFTTLQLPALAQQTTAKADTALALHTASTNQSSFTDPVEVEPEPFGGMPNFYRFIYHRLAFDNLTDRQRAISTFVIEKDGSLTHIRIVKSSMSNNMNAQIMRALYMSPRWKAGTQNGQPIRVQFSIPITNY